MYEVFFLVTNLETYVDSDDIGRRHTVVYYWEPEILEINNLRPEFFSEDFRRILRDAIKEECNEDVQEMHEYDHMGSDIDKAYDEQRDKMAGVL